MRQAQFFLKFGFTNLSSYFLNLLKQIFYQASIEQKKPLFLNSKLLFETEFCEVKLVEMPHFLR